GIKDAMLGTHFAEMGDLKDAASHFQAAVTQDPTRASVWRLLADCNVGLGQMDLAVSAINSGAKANPNDKGLQTLQQQSSLLARAGAEGQLRPVVGTIVRDPLNSDTNIELLQIMLDGFAAHDNEMIVSRLDDLIERHPDNVEARLQLIQTYVAMERFNDALSAARRAMTDFAGDPRAARAAMEICRDARLWRDLQSTAQELKRRSPGDGLAADTAIAMAMIAQDDASDAVDQLSPYLDQFKADPKKYSSMAPVYAAALANNGQTSAAAQWLWPLVTADPYWRHIWIDAAKDLPSTTDAVAWLDKVAAIIPPDAVFDRVNLALAYDIVGRRASDPKLTQKGADMVATIAQSPAANADALQAAGMLMEAAGNWKQAEDYYRQALAKSTQLFSAANNLAMLLIRHGGDAHEALNLMRQAVQQDPRTATIYDSLAAVEEAASDPNAAVDSETTATKLQPDNLTWQVRLAGYLLDAGNRPASARMVENMDLHGFSLSSLTPTVQSQLADLRKRLKHAQN
ncbi:MAG TPA: tetratricopeptide repeat protein, partial [Tepidisphaeraceae bacterium]|nr:tetratricopeptide repeat protein [Tepidisphaeraceae bacterium]